MIANKRLCLAVLPFGMFITNASVNAALLEGHQVVAALRHQETFDSSIAVDQAGPVAVGPAIEADDLGARLHTELQLNSVIVDIDFSDTQIVITAVIDQPPAYTENIGISVFEVGEISVSLNPATNWAGFMPSRLTESNQNITVQLINLFGLQGQQIVIDVVPEPAAAGLAAVAGPALLTAHRRRRPRQA
jgi:hypothetical protein